MNSIQNQDKNQEAPLFTAASEKASNHETSNTESCTRDEQKFERSLKREFVFALIGIIALVMANVPEFKKALGLDAQGIAILWVMGICLLASAAVSIFWAWYNKQHKR